MKNTFSKTLFTFALVMIFGLSSVVSANAEECLSCEDGSTLENKVGEQSKILSTQSETKEIAPNGTEYFYPVLSSATSNARLIVNCTSGSTSGALFIYVYAPDGTLISDDWICGTDGMVVYDFDRRLSAGTYKVMIVAALTSTTCTVFVSLEG